MKNKKEIKVTIYSPRCTPLEVLSGNGDEILDSICIKAETEETLLSGEYYLDAIFLVDKEGLHKSIVNEAILKVKLDYGYEVFRIASIQANTSEITVFARQITISETLDMWLEDVRPTNTNGQGALTWILDNSKGKKDIRLFSDISKTSTAYYMNMNVYEALHTAEQSFQNRWGGEIRRRGYDLYINQKFGDFKGVQIRSRKNLTGFEVNSNIDSVVTRIKPVGFDGITIDGYVDSPLIDNYHSVKTKEIKYENVKVKSENNPDEGYDTLEQAQQELKRLAKLEYDENHIDVIQAEYTVNFIQLEYTEEYKNYALVERIYLGDEVDVYEENLDINITVRAIKKNFDILAQRTTEIVLSNDAKLQVPPTIGQVLDKMDKLETTDNALQSAIDNATNLITNGLSNSYVIVRKNEILVMDTPDINTATNVWRFNNGGLGHSSTGYNGQYSTAITQDGSIVATMITSGILNADLIRAGTIQNASGTLQIDLNSNNGIMTKSNGKNAIELAGTNLKFYDWDGLGDPVGVIYSSRLNANENISGLAIANKKNSYLTLAYENNNKFYSYVRFDKDNIDNITNAPITFFQNTDFRGNQFFFGHEINSLYNSTTNNFVVKTKNSFLVTDYDTGINKLQLERSATRFYDATKNGNAYFVCSSTGFLFGNGAENILYTTTANSIQSNLGMHINGNFTVRGNKNCIQSTENYGDVSYYSVEDCESYLTDRTMDIFTVEETKEGTYERVILLDNVFKESINLELNYTVEIIKQGWGDYRIKEQTKDYFIVESDRKDFTFKYVITGKRKGFEDERNKPFYKGVKNIDSNHTRETNDLEENNQPHIE